MTPFLSAHARAALDRLAELDASAQAADPVERVRGIRSLITALEADPATLQGVRDALAAGESWDAIAAAAGIKAPAAKWRWQGTDAEIAARQEAGRKRSTRPSSRPTDLPGHSVAEAAEKLGVSPQAVYLQVSRGKLRAEAVQVPDGRTYKRVFLNDDAAQPGGEPAGQ